MFGFLIKKFDAKRFWSKWLNAIPSLCGLALGKCLEQAIGWSSLMLPLVGGVIFYLVSTAFFYRRRDKTERNVIILAGSFLCAHAIVLNTAFGYLLWNGYTAGISGSSSADKLVGVLRSYPEAVLYDCLLVWVLIRFNIKSIACIGIYEIVCLCSEIAQLYSASVGSEVYKANLLEVTLRVTFLIFVALWLFIATGSRHKTIAENTEQAVKVDSRRPSSLKRAITLCKSIFLTKLMISKQVQSVVVVGSILLLIVFKWHVHDEHYEAGNQRKIGQNEYDVAAEEVIKADIESELAEREHKRPIIGTFELAGIEAVRQSAAMGVPTAQVLLGIRYRDGIEVEQNYETAWQWFIQAMNQGYPDAYYYAGEMFQDGLGKDIDPHAALSFYLLGAERGSVLAQHVISVRNAPRQYSPLDHDTH